MPLGCSCKLGKIADFRVFYIDIEISVKREVVYALVSSRRIGFLYMFFGKAQKEKEEVAYIKKCHVNNTWHH